MVALHDLPARQGISPLLLPVRRARVCRKRRAAFKRNPAPQLSVGVRALAGASGNIGVNLAADALNPQTNQIALITTSYAAVILQQNVHTTTRMTGSANAEAVAEVLAGINGNVGVNITAGVSNVRFNGLVVR
jgi:hypothetical protein